MGLSVTARPATHAVTSTSLFMYTTAADCIALRTPSTNVLVLGLVKGFLSVVFYSTYLGPVCLFHVFCVFGVFSPVCFELSVPVQVTCHPTQVNTPRLQTDSQTVSLTMYVRRIHKNRITRRHEKNTKYSKNAKMEKS